MGNANTFIDLILQNANRVQTGWKKGQVIITDYKNISFSKENCYNALSKLAQEFETEFWIEGQTIHLTKRRRDTGYEFRHGKNLGLYKVVRATVDNASVVTRLYATGGDRNLPSDYRSFSKRLKMTGGADYVEANTASYGIIEHSEIFEDIYPRRTGQVSSVNAANFFQFFDDKIDFNINDQLLSGLAAKVTFNTGNLTGYSFKIKSFNFQQKLFTLLKNDEEQKLELPSQLMRPSIGDQYVLTDIKMPQTYVDAAEAELHKRATARLTEISEPQVNYKVEIDPVYMKTKKHRLSIGDEVWIVDVELGIQKKIRVISTNRKIVNEYEYDIELADIVTPGTISRILSAQADTAIGLNNLNQSMQNNSILNNNVIGDLKFISDSTCDFENMPKVTDLTNHSPVYINNATGRLVRKA